MEEKLHFIRSLTQGSIQDLGYDLYHLEYVNEEGENYLRFFIENPDGEAITLDDCEKVSRRVSELMDDKDPIDDPYFLEVSSPGIFRELYTPAHIQGALGERVRVRLDESVRGKKNFLGILKAFDGQVVTLEVDTKDETIDYQGVRLIALEPEI